MKDQDKSRNQTPRPGIPSLFPKRGILWALAIVLIIWLVIMFPPW
ncbi:hypothetical protein V8Z74_15540 [Comamonas sp. w2-DMI]